MVDKNIIIGKIFKTLYIYEDSLEKNSEDYCKYIGKLWVYLAGLGEDKIENEAVTMIKGLKALGMEADHNMVKSTIFKVINMVKE